MTDIPTGLDRADVFDRAADTIERNGWAQGQYFAPEIGKEAKDCRVCAIGAINVALHTTGPLPRPSQQATFNLAYVVADYLGVDELDEWNDAADRTAEQVIAALRGAAAAERERAR